MLAFFSQGEQLGSSKGIYRGFLFQFSGISWLTYKLSLIFFSLPMTSLWSSIYLLVVSFSRLSFVSVRLVILLVGLLLGKAHSPLFWGLVLFCILRGRLGILLPLLVS